MSDIENGAREFVQMKIRHAMDLLMRECLRAGNHPEQPEDLRRFYAAVSEEAKRVHRDAKHVRVQYDEERNLLLVDHYEVDLDACETAQASLDWIAQVSKKMWVTDAALGRLVREMNARIHFQTSQCGGAMCRGAE